jgi:hypothetical protein
MFRSVQDHHQAFLWIKSVMLRTCWDPNCVYNWCNLICTVLLCFLLVQVLWFSSGTVTLCNIDVCSFRPSSHGIPFMNKNKTCTGWRRNHLLLDFRQQKGVSGDVCATMYIRQTRATGCAVDHPGYELMSLFHCVQTRLEARRTFYPVKVKVKQRSGMLIHQVQRLRIRGVAPPLQCALIAWYCT